MAARSDKLKQPDKHKLAKLDWRLLASTSEEQRPHEARKQHSRSAPGPCHPAGPRAHQRRAFNTGRIMQLGFGYGRQLPLPLVIKSTVRRISETRQQLTRVRLN